MHACEDLVVLLLVLHDFGWVTKTPEIGIPALTFAFCVQVRITLASCARGGLSLANQTAILFWLVGSNVWTCCEFMWTDSRPAGFLAGFQTLVGLDRSWYAPLMEVACVDMLATCSSLVLMYIVRWCVLSLRGWWREARVPLVSQTCHNAEESCETPVLLRCIPLHVYSELFLLPWLIMDTSWEYINYRMTLGDRHMSGYFIFSVAAGIIALGLQIDSLRHSWSHGRCLSCGDIVGSVAEFFWVLGNIVWMVEDVLTAEGNFVAWCISVVLFVIGALLMIVALVCHQRDSRNAQQELELSLVQGACDDPTDFNGGWWLQMECEGQWSLAGDPKTQGHV